MGRISTLEDNGYVQDTIEFKNMHNKLIKLEDTVNGMKLTGVSKIRTKKLYSLLRELDESGLKFDIGRVNGKILLSFLETLNLDNCNKEITQLLKICFNGSVELNPLHFGYGEIKVETLNQIKNNNCCDDFR